MSINVCNESLETTTIESSCVTADGFEVENLLQDQQLNQGFQAERFTKCPVFILLQFCIPIDLHQIIIQPWLGKQCAKIVHIYTLKKHLNTLEKLKFEDVRFKAGTATISSKTEVVFNNKRYKNDPKLNSFFQASHSTGHKCDLKGQFNHVTAIKIGVHVMLNGSIPSVRLLKVFGKPSANSSTSDAENIISRWKNKCRTFEENQEPSSSSIKPEKSQKGFSSNKNDAAQNDFPQIFIDPITCNQMTNPILLPSGHTIDHKTLDKHILTLEERGRLPSDPFTGILFTELNKPIPNFSLKQQLDCFSMRISSNKACVEVVEVSKKRMSASPPEFPNPKKTKKEQDSDSASKIKHPPAIIIDSLEICLKKAKEKNSTFRPIHNNNNSTNTNNLHCLKCNIYLFSNALQYALPCHHKFCRKCLLDLCSKLKCPTCHKIFSYSDVERVYID